MQRVLPDAGDMNVIAPLSRTYMAQKVSNYSLSNSQNSKCDIQDLLETNSTKTLHYL
jgi:hypothetical protein